VCSTGVEGNIGLDMVGHDHCFEYQYVYARL